MATLELGVLEVGYTQREPGGTNRTTTTYQVAEILESRYHVMATFYERRKEKIANLVADNVATAIQDLISGQRTSPTYRAEQGIEAQFRQFLDANEMQLLAMLVGNIASVAALKGVSHRKLHPYAKKNPARPAFVDTGLFRSSFRCRIKL